MQRMRTNGSTRARPDGESVLRERTASSPRKPEVQLQRDPQFRLEQPAPGRF